MNGPLSIVDDIELHNSKVSNLEETSNENKERMDGTEGGDVLSERERKLDMESSVTEGQVVGAPTEKTASVGLDERLRRSLGTPLEEVCLTTVKAYFELYKTITG
ncbi:hypothetical protein FG379_000703 [Cryptosporidium bovis]|uniref:uncharacterized protein n=1 Tax=Cryptosporidium bovis TaxID=310047 RepID=UPI003519DDAB|nr:hypothetical protein FG379_000703 [Cryptosporidium bovis]